MALAHAAPATRRQMTEAPLIADFRRGVTCLNGTQLCGHMHTCVLLRIRWGAVRRHHGHTTRTDRPLSHGTGRVGSVSLASFKSGLWARLLRWTMTSWAVIWMAPGVSTNFRYNLDGPARASP